MGWAFSGCYCFFCSALVPAFHLGNLWSPSCSIKSPHGQSPPFRAQSWEFVLSS